MYTDYRRDRMWNFCVLEMVRATVCRQCAFWAIDSLVDHHRIASHPFLCFSESLIVSARSVAKASHLNRAFAGTALTALMLAPLNLYGRDDWLRAVSQVASADALLSQASSLRSRYCLLPNRRALPSRIPTIWIQLARVSCCHYGGVSTEWYRSQHTNHRHLYLRVRCDAVRTTAVSCTWSAYVRCQWPCVANARNPPFPRLRQPSTKDCVAELSMSSIDKNAYPSLHTGKESACSSVALTRVPTGRNNNSSLNGLGGVFLKLPACCVSPRRQRLKSHRHRSLLHSRSTHARKSSCTSSS